jgi:NADPH-dependent 2,4-dienoyl-CoA reductase/sulfur reductase-like enzyme
MHFVIIGNGVAGITAAFALRSRDAAAQITVIGGESDYFISRTALMYAFMDRLTLRDLEPFERHSYSKQRIDLVRGWVDGLDADSRIVKLHDGRKFTYDRLLIASGSIPNSAPWAGLDSVKSGLVNFVSLQHLAECERLAPSTRRAVVAGGGLIGVELVECLHHHGIHVDFLVRDSWYWPMALAKEEGEIIAEHIRHHGVNLHLGHEITEVHAGADGRIASIRTNQGTEFPCQMLGACIGVKPAIDWLRDVRTPPALGRGIKIQSDFRTSLPNVWAAGDCAELPNGRVEQIWYSAKRHGELAANAMLGDPVDYRQPLFYNSAKLFDIEYTTVGAPGPDSFFRRLAGKHVSIRIMHDNGAVTGFNMLGSRWNHTWFEQWIHERRPLAYVLENLHRAQFDVEFGRLSLAGLGVAS